MTDGRLHRWRLQREPRARAAGPGRSRRRRRSPAAPAPHTTNQRMEIAAASRRCGPCPGRSRWSATRPTSSTASATAGGRGGCARGGCNSQRKPVANRDLWEPFVELVARRAATSRSGGSRATAGDPMNDLVDRLAVEAAATQQGRRGTGPPTSSGPADVAGPAPAAPGEPDHRRPRRWSCLGHRPTELGGYDDNPLAAGRAGPAGRDHRGQGGRRADAGGGQRAAAGGRDAGGRGGAGGRGARWSWCCPIPIPSRCGPRPAARGSHVLRARATQVIAAAEAGADARSSRPGRRWPGATPGWPATRPRPCWCGTAPTPRSASCSARSRTTWATTCGCSTRPSWSTRAPVKLTVRVGSDTGGTFTDLVGDDGRIAKVPSTPDDPGRAVAARRSTRARGDEPPDVLAHGTTVGHQRAARAARRHGRPGHQRGASPT